MLRTKQGIANSFASPDTINQLDWSRKAKYKAVFNYYHGLVALRKNHPAFRMPSAKMIREHLHFMDSGDPGVVAYRVSGNANGDKWKNIIVIFNGSTSDKKVIIQAGKWKMAVDGNGIDEKGLKNIGAGEMPVAATSACVLYEQ
jgi:pullulanase